MGDEAFNPALRPVADVGTTSVTFTGDVSPSAADEPDPTHDQDHEPGQAPAPAHEATDADARLEANGWRKVRGAYRRH